MTQRQLERVKNILLRRITAHAGIVRESDLYLLDRAHFKTRAAIVALVKEGVLERHDKYLRIVKTAK